MGSSEVALSESGELVFYCGVGLPQAQRDKASARSNAKAVNPFIKHSRKFIEISKAKTRLDCNLKKD